MSRLEIFVSAAGCGPCSRARQIGAEMTGVYPDVEVSIIEIDNLGPDGLPEEVVAVPTYLLDGTVISLGNPRVSALREKLTATAVAGG